MKLKTKILLYFVIPAPIIVGLGAGSAYYFVRQNLLASQSEQAIELAGKTASIITFFATLVVVLLAVLAYLVARNITKPIVEVTQVINRISRGDFEAEVDESILRSEDEIGDFARAFDRVVVSLKLAMKEVKKEKKKT